MKRVAHSNSKSVRPTRRPLHQTVLASENQFRSSAGVLACIVLVVLGIVLVRARAATTQPTNRLRWQGKDIYANGVNVPWFQWSTDFGGGANSGVVAHKAVIAAKFAQLKASNVHVVRWWTFEGGANQILRDSNNNPTGLDPAIYQDFDAAIDLANTYDLYYDFSLFPDTLSFPATWRTDPTQRQKLATVLGPLFARYKNEPRVMSWEIYNEPEFDIWYRGVDADSVKNMARTIITSIRSNAPNTLVTVGEAFINGMQYWTDVDLDYDSPHWYDPAQDADSCALCTTAAAVQAKYHTTRPIVIGEYYVGDGDTNAHLARENQWYNQGYAGAWTWSLFGDAVNGASGTSDHYPVDFAAMKTFAGQHADVGPVAGTGDSVAPSTPTGLAASNITTTSIKLSWSASTDNTAVAGYHVYRGGILVGSPTATNYTDSSLNSNTGYTYSVNAFDASGNTSPNSTAITAQTLSMPITVPPPPPKAGDANGDGAVNIFDASIVSAHWLLSGQTRAQGDLNGDGVVNIFDASIISANWGK